MNQPIEKQHLVILGGGASGAISLLNCKKILGDAIKMTVIEPRAEIGMGRAYSVEGVENILNVPVEKMGAFEDSPGDFLAWVKKTYPDCEKFKYWPFLPRAWFGAFLKSQLEALGPNSFTHLKTEVLSMKQEGGKWNLKTRDQKTVIADGVIVASGYRATLNHETLSAQDPSVFERVIQPYDTEKMKQISPKDQILVLGTGLTGIDILRQIRLITKVPVTFMSRRGRFPVAHLATPFRGIIKLPRLSGLSPIQIFQTLRTLKKTGSLEWPPIADQTRLQAQEIWSCWTAREKKQFLRHLRPLWEIIRHRLPYSVAEELAIERQNQTVQVVAGRIQNTRVEGNSLVLSYRPKPSRDNPTVVQGHQGQKSQELRCNWIILATDSHIDQTLLDHSPIFGLKKCSLGFGYVNESAPNLWLSGPSSKSTYWEVTAVPEIRKQAYCLAKEIKRVMGTQNNTGTWCRITHHPREAGESYVEHFAKSMKMTLFLFWRSVLLLIHTIFPFLYTDRVSNDIRNLSYRLTRRRARKIKD